MLRNLVVEARANLAEAMRTTACRSHSGPGKEFTKLSTRMKAHCPYDLRLPLSHDIFQLRHALAQAQDRAGLGDLKFAAAAGKSEQKRDLA